jgi:hypothetical protein
MAAFCDHAFGPIMLELQGFYAHPLQKTTSRSFAQLGRAAFWLGMLIAACSFFLRLEVPSRAVMPLFAVFATIALLIRERVSVATFETPFSDRFSPRVGDPCRHPRRCEAAPQHLHA